MILLFGVQNERASFATIDKGVIRHVLVKGERVGFRALDRAKMVLLKGKKPTHIALVAARTEGEERVPSWSTVRSGVAMVNSLAFAWGVPAFEMHVAGSITDKMLIARVLAAAKKAKIGRWVGAAYSGEPNITVAKKII